MYLAGIDLGTTGCKSMVFDSRGAILGSHYIEYGLLFTEDGVEQDAALWWEYAKTALKEAIKAAGVEGGDLSGIGISSQGIASVPVDVCGRPLSNAVSWYDTRAQKEADALAAQYGEEWLFKTTGRHPGSLFFPQVLYIKEHNPELYDRAAFFLMAQDYLVYRLCGEAVTDYTMASGTLCFDTLKHAWIAGMFDRSGIDAAKFPRIKRFGEVAGRILPAVAQELGVSENTVIAVGMQDQKAAALGAGIGRGSMTLSIGTASAVSVLSDSPVADPSGRVPCHAFDDSRWILENSVGASGAALKWVRDVMLPNTSYSDMDALALAGGPGAGGVLFVPGLGQGNGAFTGLSLSSRSADLVRAALEGVAYAIRECVEIQREVSAAAKEAGEIRVFGGGAKSSLWCQILADCLGMPVVVTRTQETSNLGAALCAGMALGLFADEKDRKAFVGDMKAIFTPQAKDALLYDEGYAQFKRLQNAIKTR
ncbi:xylulokinase [Spirochaetia bacterium]|nr:xylulokinase [Spirochaetia bacterium]